MKILAHFDLGKVAQLKNALLDIVAGDLSSPVEGGIWYNSVAKTVKFRTNAADINVLDLAVQTGTIATAQIAADAVDNTKLANVATQTFKGRTTASTGDPEDLTVAQAKTLLGLTGTNSGDQTITLTGDVTGSGTGSFATAIGSLVIVDGDVNAAAAIARTKIANPTADVSNGGFKITSLATPTAGTDAANKDYVDNAIAGLAWKESVRVATTATGTIATAFANGQTVDGVVIATGNRILLKNQSAGAENGIYTVNASGAPTRATDADSTTDIQSATVFIEEGTANAGAVWTLSTDAVTVGTTAQVWVQFGGSSTTYTASTGVLLTGSNFTAVADPTPATIISAAAGLSVDTTNNNYKIPRKYFAASVASTVTTVTHNLGSGFTLIQVFDQATGETVEADVVRTSNNACTVTFLVAPAAGAYSIVVIG